MSTTVHVSNISPQTSEHEVRDFFSFCGKISSLSLTPSSSDPSAPKSATVTFEKETAAKTALLLDNTQLGSSQVKVEAAHSLDDIAASPTEGGKDGDEIQQEDKPRSRILAEYIAHGYVIGDKTIQRAIELDQKHGLYQRFTTALQNFDNKLKATDRAKTVDASYGVTDKAKGGWRGMQSYFEKVLGTATGQRLVAFYTSTEKQVMDIHNEARRLAELRKQEQGTGAATGDHKSSSSQFPGDNTATGPAADVMAATHLQPAGSNYPQQAVGNADEVTKNTGVAPVTDRMA